jgi:hypothetical protein
MAEHPPSTTSEFPIRRRWRFAVVLAASLLLSVAQPLTAGLLGEENSFDAFFSLLIVAVLLLVFEEKRHRRMAFSVGVAAFLGVWLGHGLGGPAGQTIVVGAQLLGVCFFGFALCGILRGVLTRQTSGDAIFGAVCGYLLLGIIWGLLYSTVEISVPGSIVSTSQRAAGDAAGRLDRGGLSYYSFITLATVGYGDITPTTPLARTLAWMEAITGQFYLAVLVAGLVGFKVTQAMTDSNSSKERPNE